MAYKTTYKHLTSFELKSGEVLERVQLFACYSDGDEVEGPVAIFLEGELLDEDELPKGLPAIVEQMAMAKRGEFNFQFVEA